MDILRMSSGALVRQSILMPHFRFHTAVRSCSASVQLAHTIYESEVSTSLNSPPLIIIHGLFGSKRNWDSLSKAFNKQGLKVITLDCRNHGESPHESEMSYQSMAGDVEALTKELGITNAFVLGHSMGGKVAMTLALSKPSLVRKLIIEDISPKRSSVVDSPSVFEDYIKAQKSVEFNHSLNMSDARKDVGQQLMSTFPDPGLRAFVLTNLIQRESRYQWAINLEALEKNIQDIMSFPKFTSCYNGPCAFIGGEKSKHISDEDISEIHRLFPKATIQHIADAGHWVHAEKPSQFKQAVLDFLAKDTS